MGITRKFVSWLPSVCVFLTMVAAFDWVDYHTKGSTPLWGINPRCIDSSFGRCWKLNTNNMPWDATAATWLASDGWYLMLLCCIVAGAFILVGAIEGLVLLVQVAASPHQERLSRIADNRRLSSITIGLFGSFLIGLVGTLLWAQWEIVAILLILPGTILTMLASTWSSEWASRYRHERFLAAEARRRAVTEVLRGRVPASLRRFAVVYRFGYVGGIRHGAGKRRHIGVTQHGLASKRVLSLDIRPGNSAAE